MIKKSRMKFDVLATKPIRRMLGSPMFPLVFQVITLIGILWLAFNSFGVGSGMGSDQLLTLRKTNLTTLAIWGLWWPAMIAMALAFGRAWCAVCPMEMVNRIGDAVARRIGWPRARLGKFLRAGWLILAAYLALQLLVAGFSIHRVPHIPAMPFGWIEGLWFLVLFPAGVWAAISGISYAMGYRSNIKSLLLAAATGAAPVVAIAHLAKAAAKVSSWGGFLPLAVRDPQGIETLRGLTAHTLGAPAGLLALSLVGWAMLALSLVMAWKAWKWSKQVPAQYLGAARTGLASAALFFGIILTIWAWRPVS